jgi:transposase
MSTSILYHGFGIKGYDYVRTKFAYGCICFKIHQDRFNLRCPLCNGRDVIRRGFKNRFFRLLPIGKKKAYVEFNIPRIECLACKIIRQVKVGFADTRRSYTKAFERYALDLCQRMTIQDVANHLGVSWDTIKDIQKRFLQKRFSKPKLKHLKKIAIDEISIGKGHRYLTVVLDLITGVVVFVGDGKSSDALIPFWKRLKASKANVEAVAIDMSPAYIRAVKDNLPNAKIVFDHFHIIKMFNDKLSDFRRELQREVKDSAQHKVLKGTRWLLLKNPDNLKEQKNERQRLESALELNKPLATAYYMKEDLRQLWNQKNQTEAQTFLDDWIKRAQSSEIQMLIDFADTLENHKKGILAYYQYPISTGPLEGTNNKIKTLQRQAYGFRDKEFFKLKIYALHLTKYALVG